MSLSPRPERLTMTIGSGGQRRRDRWSAAIACALSSARNDALGRAPAAGSASSASSSVTATYSARPVSLQEAVLRADARIVEAGGDRVRLGRLPVVVLQQVRQRAVQHADAPAGSVAAWRPLSMPVARRLDAEEPHARVGTNGVEQAHGVRAAADAGDAARRAAAPPPPGSAPAPRRPITAWKSRTSSDTDAARRPSRCSSASSRTFVTQSRIASFIASFSVACRRSTGMTFAPSSFMRKTFSAWRSHVLRAHVDLARAGRTARTTVAVATPCCPAPVSAMMRGLPMRRGEQHLADARC